MKTFRYLINCVAAHGDDINEMKHSAREITWGTFSRHCDWEELAQGLGYAARPPALRLRDDWHVRFYRGKYKGEWCYFLVHSAIEYIFVERAGAVKA